MGRGPLVRGGHGLEEAEEGADAGGDDAEVEGGGDDGASVPQHRDGHWRCVLRRQGSEEVLV